MASTGSNKLEDLFRSRGTGRLTPLCGVVGGNGGVVTATATGGVVTINYTAASVLLDSLLYSITAGSLATPALQDGANEINVYVTPTCKN